jgi:hypothetical protein
VNAAADTVLQVLERWVRTTPAYSYVVDATEFSGSRTESTTFEIAYDTRAAAEHIHVTAGPGAGSNITWTGGDHVSVRPPGIVHMLTVSLDVRNPKIISMRGNDIRTGVLSRVVACFRTHAEHLTTERIEMSGQSLAALTMTEPAGVRCGPEDGDIAVTRDRILISPATGLPVMRERYAGSALVERWVIRDLHATT